MHRPSADLLDAMLPALRFSNAVTNEPNQQRWSSAHHKHCAPTKARTDEVIRNRGEKNSDVIAGVH